MPNERELAMNPKTILCPIDFSPCSDEAVVHAAALARANGAEIALLHVTAVPAAYEDGIPIYSPYAETLAKDREALRAYPSPEGVEVSKHHRIGEPADEILAFATERNVELIVMGTHGRKGLGRWLFGSVAEKVVRQATCPVLTYRATPAVASQEPRTE